jgi:hypothetical protein
MQSWLKLVGAADWLVPEHWVHERSDLLTEVRFGKRHPPDGISLGDHLVYHAVVDRRLIAVVEVLSADPRYDIAKEWEKRWPFVLDIRPLLKVGRVSEGPSTDILNLADSLFHESFLRLKPETYAVALKALKASGAH